MGDGRESHPWERAKAWREHQALNAALRKTVWGDWRRARISDLVNFSKHPLSEARKIADGEMKLLQQKP